MFSHVVSGCSHLALLLLDICRVSQSVRVGASGEEKRLSSWQAEDSKTRERKELGTRESLRLGPTSHHLSIMPPNTNLSMN